MVNSSIVTQYFSGLNKEQLEKFERLDDLYGYWNSQINVISRKDIDNLMVHHVLHSLSIARIINFARGTKIMDVGTGGGFPGIPLAIMFPQCQFTLVESVAKKAKVCGEVARSLGLDNVEVLNMRAEALSASFDFAVSRAVATIPQLMEWVEKNIHSGGMNQLPNGLICLKGGTFSDELKPYRKFAQTWKVSNFFDDEYFVGKYIIYIQV
jgi:16S rRNA (guanine527-N7)-methyltransferase